MGVGVATLLAADEIEHHRCGIACVLENTAEGSVAVQRIIRGGTADNTALEEGDLLLEVDGHTVGSLGVAGASDFIRGKEGSFVVLKVKKRTGQVVVLQLQRQRVPGSKAELLGALWQQQGQAKKKVWTTEDKLGKLDELFRRGNLSRIEYEAAVARLTTGEAPTTDDDDTDSGKMFGEVWSALSQDIAVLTEDPDVRKLKLQRKNSLQSPTRPQTITAQRAPPDADVFGMLNPSPQTSPTAATWSSWDLLGFPQQQASRVVM